MQGSSWNRHGNYLAAAFNHQLIVIRYRETDESPIQVVASWDRATDPVWSPRGDRLAFYHWEEQPAVVVVQPPEKQVQSLLTFDRQSQPPLWLNNDQLLVQRTARRPKNERGDLAYHTEVVGIEVSSRTVTPFHQLSNPHFPADVPPREVWFQLTPDGHTLHLARQVEQEPMLLQMIRPREDEVFRRWHPLDASLAIGQLTLSPDGNFLAVRLGQVGPQGVVTAINLTTHKHQLILPSEAVRLQAAYFLAMAMESVLELHNPGTPELFPRSEMPVQPPIISRLPLFAPAAQQPGNWVGQLIIRQRSERLLSYAEGVLNSGIRLPPVAQQKTVSFDSDARGEESACRRGLLEMQLFFACCEQDWAKAEQILGELFEYDLSPEEALRVMGARGQLLAAQGKHLLALTLLDDLFTRTEQWQQGEVKQTLRLRAEQLLLAIEYHQREVRTAQQASSLA